MIQSVISPNQWMTRLLSSKNLLARYERRGFKSTTTIDRSSCKNKEELQYFPLYDYRTKRPVSFLFLSAGIDGKIDNKLSHNDTLYVHNWWADLNVYNYEEAILLENWNKNARECWALSNTPKDVQLPPQPRVHGIRFIDYFVEIKTGLYN